MSFLSATVLPGSTRLHIEGGGATAGTDGRKRLRTSRSHASFLSPLVQLLRDPVGIIGTAVANVSLESKSALSQSEEAHKQVLYLRMRNAESYDDWKAVATELDILEGNDAWKSEDESFEYDAALVAARLQQLDEARLNCNVKRMLFLIRTSLTRGLGGMGDLRLYKHSHVGTKSLIERYIDSAQKTLEALLEVSAKQGENCPIEPSLLVEQLLLARQSFGRSALLLSGGGTFGMNHIGVVKSLFHARLLPRIISGASAGSIVCAVLCTKTDAEVPNVLEEFCYGDKAVFEKEGEEDSMFKKAARFLKYGALFDITHLMNVMRNLLGDITFQESYNRTRRILNITVSSASLYELPRLLNYVTAPNVMIWSAVCASCSVPFIFSAASLLAKDPKTGKEVPWNPTPNAGWIDGSVDNDLPMTRLAEMFNVNHFIVSQVNPHVIPFLAKDEEIIGAQAQQNSAVSAGPTWMHNFTNLAKGEALHRLHVLSELGIFPNYLTKARSILNQRYSGDITIFPSISYAQFPKVLTNPTTEYMLQALLTGERATWPKLSRIQNHLAIELALDDTIRQLRTRVVFSPGAIDLRLNNINRPLSQGHDRSRLPQKTGRLTRDTAPSTPWLTSLSPIVSQTTKTRVKRTSTQVMRPYLPTHPLRKHTRSLDQSRPTTTAFDAFSSSTNPEGTSSDDELSDSDTSDLLSSPSPTSSTPTNLPTLWPSTRQLFPSASQPTTPSMSGTLVGHRSKSLLNLTMTSNPDNGAPPSSPELRYKRLFHPPPSESQSNLPRIDSDTQSEVEKTIQPSHEGPAPLLHTKTNPETQTTRSTALLNTVSYTGKSDPALEEVYSTQPGPVFGSDGKATSTAPSGSKTLVGIRERSHGVSLPLDISGTRGMMLRRKRSSKSLHTMNQ